MKNAVIKIKNPALKRPSAVQPLRSVDICAGISLISITPSYLSYGFPSPVYNQLKGR